MSAAVKIEKYRENFDAVDFESSNDVSEVAIRLQAVATPGRQSLNGHCELI
jgi:hypothetical protein